MTRREKTKSTLGKKDGQVALVWMWSNTKQETIDSPCFPQLTTSFLLPQKLLD